MRRPPVNIIGGGYAGSEAALALAQNGVEVHLFDVNNFSYDATENTKLNERIKNELLALGCQSLEGGEIDNLLNLHENIDKKLKNCDKIKIFNENVCEISLLEPTLIATGSKTSAPLFSQIENFVGKLRAHKTQGIFPKFRGKIEGAIEENGHAILPLEKEKVREAFTFLKGFSSEKDCLEKWVQSGEAMLRAKAFRPVIAGGKVYESAIRLKIEGENLLLENFQTELSKENQRKLFAIFPPLRNLEIVEYGGVENSTFICPGAALNKHLQSVKNESVFFAGKVMLASGQLEAIATGHLAALNILNYIDGRKLVTFPKETIVGKFVDKLFSSEAFKHNDICFDCDIISSVEESGALARLKKFKEEYNARVSWHNNLCSKKRW